MGIRVEHGPSMVPVGRMAYRTGQNEYINKRRKELEALAEQRANRQQKSQMQINDINAGFQQIQMQHQQGMQRAAAQNEFQLDRDQRNHDWGVKAAGDLFNRQKELNDQRHQQGLARFEFGQDLQNQAMIDNNRAQEEAETFDRLYGTSNQAGRDKINQFQAQQVKLRGHIDRGQISQEQYDAQYSEAKATLMKDLTGKNSELYQIGAEHQVGGKTPMWGGAMDRIVGEGGAVIFDRRYEIDPATGEQETPEQWSEKWEKVQYDSPDDKIGWHYEYGSDGTRRRESQEHLQKYTATNKFNMEATKLLIERRQGEAEAGRTEPLTKSDALAKFKEQGEMYDALHQEPKKEDTNGETSDAWKLWQSKRQAAQVNILSDEERVLFGLGPLLKEHQKAGGAPALSDSAGNPLNTAPQAPANEGGGPRASNNYDMPVLTLEEQMNRMQQQDAREAQKLEMLNALNPQMMQ